MNPLLRQIWAITEKELKLWAQERSQWLLVFLTPLVFIAIMGSVFGSGGAPAVAVYLVNEDTGRVGKQVVDALEDTRTLAVETLASRAEADRRVGDGERMAAIIVPSGLSAAAVTDAGATIEVIVDPAREQSAGMVLGQVQAATAPLLVDAEVTRGVHKAFNTAPELLGISATGVVSSGLDLVAVEKFLTAALKGVVASQVQDALEDPLVGVAAQPAAETTSSARPTIYDYLVPGYTAFFAFFLMGMMADTLLAERVSGTLRRMFSMPVGRAGFLLGKSVPYALIAILQIVVVMGVSSVAFAFDLGQSPPAFALMAVASGVSVAGLGAMIAVLVRTEGQANSLPNLLTIGMAVVSGAMFPTIRVPVLEWFTPQYWIVQGFLKVTALDAGLAQIAPDAAMLLALGLGFFAIGLWRFTYE